MQKLKVYEELKEKLEVLLKVINDRNGFSNKKMTIDADEGVKFYSDNGIEIPLEKMSSGEKNDFILFYELIFKCQSNSLILIDEPEISLHIAWQQEFINELLEICRINDMQAIVATHSPNIVDEHWDLLCDMAGDE
jgi:predicted ATP-binding protein involved in virulence